MADGLQIFAILVLFFYPGNFSSADKIKNNKTDKNVQERNDYLKIPINKTGNVHGAKFQTYQSTIIQAQDFLLWGTANKSKP